jgi:hypothetical protein
MLRAKVEPDFRITIPEDLRSQVQVGDEVFITLTAAGRLTLMPEARVRTILEETAGLWQGRTDLPADGAAYVNALRQSPASSPVQPAPALAEMIEFLSQHPTAEQMAAFKISEGAQARLAELLEKNREEGLSDAENAELDWYEDVHDILTRRKARAGLGAA